MKISNAKIVSTDLTNNTVKISFTISEATENVNIYLKINDEEYKKIFSNKTNEDLEYTANISRGVNNLLLKATDSTTEYITEPIQVLLKEAPSIENLECSYSDSTGKYILNFAFNGDTNFKYNIYLKLDANDYIEVLSNQISGDKTIEQTSAMGEHTCILKVSDGYDDYTFSSFQFEITNHKLILSKVLVTDITNDGEAYIYYSTKDIESSTLTHKLVIGTTETVITPTQVDNFYSYKITGLLEGISNCTINISDDIDTVSSDVFSIEVFSDTTDKKELLRRAKVRYDSAYQQLRDIIVSVISDLKYDYDIENALISKAQDNYKIEYSNFNKISQQSIDTIGSNKVKVTKQELQSEINDVDSAVNSLETTMWGVFQDGILDQSERDTLSGSLDLVAKEKIDIDKDYEALYNNEDLLDPSKTKLQTNYNNFIEAHNSLVTTINNIINKEGIVDNTDKSRMDSAFENWRTALGDYRVASLEAIDAIAKKKADDSADVVDKKWAEIVLDPETGIKSQVGSLQSKITGAGGIEERLKTAEQTITTDGISNIVKDVYYTKTEVDNKVTNVDNKIKTTVKSVNVMYYLSTSTTELIGGTWSNVAPTWEADKYMWSKTVTTLSDGTIKESSPTCIAGAKGQDGVPGTNGKTTYTWIKYADDENGNGISNNPTNKSYIGFAYNKTTNIESNSPSDYTWSLIKGANGADGKDGTSVTILGSYNSVGELNQAHPNNNNNGDGYIVNGDLYIWDGKSFTNVGQIKGEDGKNGVDGQDGKNGLNAYVHIKYSNDGGKTFTPSNGEEVGDYLGIYTDYYEADSTDVTKYTWSKIKGQDGVPGTNGKDGVTTYTWVKYSNNADGTGLYNTPNSQTKYIGIATNKTTATESTNKTDYIWSLFRGEDGSDGTGIESITEEYYLSTSKTTQTGGSWVTTPPTWKYGKYIWTRSKIVYKDPASTVYTTPICDSSWEAVDEIEIGGRNLVKNADVLNSLFSVVETYKGTRTVVNDVEAKSKKHLEFKCTTAGNGFHTSIFPKTSDKVGKTYTWSFWAKCSVNKSGTVGHECGGQRTINLTTEWQKFTKTWVFTDAVNNSFTWYLNWKVGEILYVRDFKIEEGNKATDWTPAPEDVQNQIDENKNEVNTRMSVVEQTIDSWGVKITENENEIASLKLTDEQFEVKIGNKADSSNIISVINASTEGIKISSSKVNISGFVTFSDLSNPNSYTTIHGSNIATKTISASDISTGILTGCLLQTYSDSTSKGVRIAKESLSLNGTNFFYYTNDEFRIVSDQRFSVASVNDIYLMPGLNGNTGQTSGTGAVVIPNSTLRTQKLYVVDESNFTGNVTFNTNIKLNGGLNCPGDIAVSGNISVDGTAWISTLSVTNSSILKGVSCTSISATGTVKTTGSLQGGGISTTGNMSVDGIAWIATLYVNGNYVTSDETLKTDIKYVNMDTQELTEDGLMSPNVNITTSDMHQFIETLPMVSYRLTEDVEKGEDNTYYGFLAQEILYTKVGSELIKMPNDKEKELIGDKLRYSENKFIAFICGALQEEIKQRKALERQLNDLINTINK